MLIVTSSIAYLYLIKLQTAEKIQDTLKQALLHCHRSYSHKPGIPNFSFNGTHEVVQNSVETFNPNNITDIHDL